MCLQNRMNESIVSFSQQIEMLQEKLKQADAVLIGAGAGLSTAAGFIYSGERFDRYFQDFHEKYGITDIYSGGFYPFETLEEYWAWWSRHIFYNRYVDAPVPVYDKLRTAVKGTDYFVLTTNVDHQFQRAGFDKRRLFYTQGDYGLWQCSRACHDRTYDNEVTVRRMLDEQEDMKVPSELVPYCPVCGAPMAMNLRSDDTFVQDKGWYEAAGRYEAFLKEHGNGRILLLELGVGGNTPGIIKYPFWQMTAANSRASYICINYGEAAAPFQISSRSVCIDEDIDKVMTALLKLKSK